MRLILMVHTVTGTTTTGLRMDHKSVTITAAPAAVLLLIRQHSLQHIHFMWVQGGDQLPDPVQHGVEFFKRFGQLVLLRPKYGTFLTLDQAIDNGQPGDCDQDVGVTFVNVLLSN